MARAKTERDRVAAALHETATDLHEIGVTDKRTMREFDELCLRPVRADGSRDSRHSGAGVG